MASSAWLSTTEVAVLFEVAESTIKRWADAGLLACTKTPGGHRKFRETDVIAFSKKLRYPATGLLPPPPARWEESALEVGVRSEDFALLADMGLQELLRDDGKDLYDFLNYLVKQGISFARIADRMIRPAMHEIGLRWRSGDLRIDQEHQASQKLLETLARLAPHLHRKPEKHLTAVCACLEGERHHIGLQCLAYALEFDGWSVNMLGDDVPTDSVRALVREMQPDLVCLSTVKGIKGATKEAIRSLARTVHAQRGLVLLGGAMVRSSDAVQCGADLVAETIEEAMSNVRNQFGLRPGPKKRRPSSRVVSRRDASR